jgi:hypothetical protein
VASRNGDWIFQWGEGRFSMPIARPWRQSLSMSDLALMVSIEKQSPLGSTLEDPTSLYRDMGAEWFA